MKAQLLLLESGDYSTKALEFYQSRFEIIYGLKDANLIADKVEILVVRLAHQINSDLLSPLKNLRWILSPTTGHTHIDEPYCQKRGIQVLSLKDMTSQLSAITSTAELSWGLIIALIRNIPSAHEKVVKEGEWIRDQFRSRQLNCLQIGIVGMGRIGFQIAKYAEAFGMPTAFFDPKVSSVKLVQSTLQSKQSIEELLRESTVVSIHIPADAENFNFINPSRLQAMPVGSYLINTSRGEVVDEFAVVKSLEEKHLAGFAADVLKNEATQNIHDSPIRMAAARGANIILTPHLGGCTIDAMQLTEEMLAKRFLSGWDTKEK